VSSVRRTGSHTDRSTRYDRCTSRGQQSPVRVPSRVNCHPVLVVVPNGSRTGRHARLVAGSAVVCARANGHVRAARHASRLLHQLGADAICAETDRCFSHRFAAVRGRTRVGSRCTGNGPVRSAGGAVRPEDCARAPANRGRFVAARRCHGSTRPRRPGR